MEPPNPFSNSIIKEYQIITNNTNFNLSIYFSNSLFFKLKYLNENDELNKFEKKLLLDDLKKISKWFNIFDSLEEVFSDIIKLIENKQINIIIENNIAKLIFDINMEKIKEVIINLEKKELTKDELIDNLIEENKQLKLRLNNLEKRFDSLEEKFNNLKNKKAENIYKNDIIYSDIINNEDKKILNIWFNSNNDKTIKLLYKASRDGDNYKDFYRLCENKGPTITIALTTKNFKFGGYTSLSWKNPNIGSNRNKSYEDKNAFIFSLNKKKKFYPKINNKNHVCMWSDRGPSFGGGNDLCIHNNCLHNNNSYNGCPNTYETEKYELNGGEFNFTVKDYEVYSIN
jgi:hypothetical protein